MVNNLTERFVDLIFELSNTKLPPEVFQKARECFVDYMAVAIGGSRINRNKVTYYLENNDVSGKIHIIGMSDSVDLKSAVMINAFNAHTLELDDGHRYAMMHMGAPIFSSLIGVAEEHKSSLESILRAAVVGYEAAIRLGSAIQPSHKKKGFHATGTCGEIGCAMAVAALLGYDKNEMLNTISAAATSSAGLLEVITGKSEQKPYNIANAAIAGVDAALFGKYFAGPEDVLDGPRGFLRCFSSEYDADRIVDPQDSFAINGIYMKPYAACRHCHAPIEAALLLGSEDAIPVKDIKEIKVNTYDLAVYGHDHNNISGANSAKMSIPYSVAVSYIRHRCGMEAFDENCIKDNEILSLADKVVVAEDATMSKLVPEKRVASVSVIAYDGTIKTKQVDYPKGEPENPITEEELMEKFNSLAAFGGCTEKDRKEIMGFIMKNDSRPIGELFEIIK